MHKNITLCESSRTPFLGRTVFLDEPCNEHHNVYRCALKDIARRNRTSTASKCLIKLTNQRTSNLKRHATKQRKKVLEMSEWKY
jgi:hypothetical protein